MSVASSNDNRNVSLEKGGQKKINCFEIIGCQCGLADTAICLW